MSRIGKNPVSIPSGVEVQLADGVMTAKGKLGELQLSVDENVDVTVEDNEITVRPIGDSKRARQMWGTTRSLVDNLVVGVSEGFDVKLEVQGVGYRADVQGKNLVLALGYSHPIEYPIPEGITITAERPQNNYIVTISGANKQRVGQVAAEIRAFRKPEPYKGKGVRYLGEYVRRKEGKKK